MVGLQKRGQARARRELRFETDLWSAYCFSLSASRIDPWPGQHARVIERLKRYLAAIQVDEAIAERVVNGVVALQRTMTR